MFTICQWKYAICDKMSRQFVNLFDDIIGGRLFSQEECDLAHTRSQVFVDHESARIVRSKVIDDKPNERLVMNLRQRLDSQLLYRAPRDLPSATRRSLQLSITALINAYDEDDDPFKIEPDDRSFRQLMEYLAHPFHQKWPPPAIAVTREGLFSAIWHVPGVDRWVLNFAINGDVSEIYLHTDPDGNIIHRTRKSSVTEYQPPFFPIEKLPH
jgi:hypothetical protein